MIWDKDHECMPREKIKEIQIDRLKTTVRRVYDNVPAYRAKMDAIGLKPEHIKTLDDLKLLPFTVKNDLRDNYPFGLFAVPQKDIVRYHASSGTTGKPIVVAYTKNDLDMWTNVLARVITSAGVGEHDTAQIAFNYGLFTGGFGLHYGLERVGASVVPVGGGNTQKQIMLMQDFGTTTLIATPSYSLHIAEVAEEMDFDFKKSKLRVGLFGGEPWSNEMRREIEKNMDILATDNYGLSEVLGPGVAGECPFARGLHISEDHFIVETIDPDTGEVLPEGSKGELVFTSLTKEAFPIIRYRTKDISRLNIEPCACGRTTARMEKVLGRVDDMLIIRGVNVFPSQIESVLLNFSELGTNYQIHVEKKGYLDTISVWVELADVSLLESYGNLESLNRRVMARIKEVVGIQCPIKIVEPSVLERSAGKAVRVIDHRK